MENFTPLSAVIGGSLIGLSAVILMGSLGRIAGISGIFAGGLLKGWKEQFWPLGFIAGLVLAPFLVKFVTGEVPDFELKAGFVQLVVGGLLVGFGTRLGSGCTSGHGVCGLSRLSVRSMVSVAIFMSAGIATVAVIKQVAGG